jgi:hypothetical protein
MSYNVGDAVPLVYTINAVATVVLTVTDPDGVVTTPSTVQGGAPPSVTYTGAVLVTKAGSWLARFVATGAVTDAEEQQFLVEPTATATLYASVGELRAAVGDDRAALDAGQLTQALRSASRAIDGYCSRSLGRFWLDPVATTRTYPPSEYRDRWCAWVDDIGSTVGLVVKTDTAGDGTWADTWAIGTDFQLEPLNAAANGGAYAWTRIVAIGSKTLPCATGYGGQRPTLQVTARHGWSQIPDPVREATLLKAARLYRRKDAPFGVAGFDEFGPVRITRSDSDVVELLGPYMNLAGFA